MKGSCLTLWIPVLLLLLPLGADEKQAQDQARQYLNQLVTEGWSNVVTQRSGYLAEKNKKAFTIPLYAGNDYHAIVAGDLAMTEIELILFDKDAGYTVLTKGSSGDGKSHLVWSPPESITAVFLVRSTHAHGNFHFYLVSKAQTKP